MSKFLMNHIGLLTTISSKWEVLRGASSPFKHELFLNLILFPQSQPVSFHVFNSFPKLHYNCGLHLLDIFSLQGFPLGSRVAPHVPTVTQSHTGNLCHPNRAFSCASCTITPTQSSLDRYFPSLQTHFALGLVHMKITLICHQLSLPAEGV